MKKNIRFYDNDQTHIENVQVNFDIECIKVESQINKPIKTNITSLKEEMKDNKFFLKYVKKIIERNLSPENKLNYDETSGITSNEMDELLEWAREGGEMVIFDFDRTIIKTEGFGIFFKNKEDSDYWFSKDLNELMSGYLKVDVYDVESTVNDFLVYICGGKERLTKLRQMFQELNALNVKIYINSMNLACDSRLFRDVVNRIIVVDNEIQCSDYKRGKLHEINGMLKKRLYSSSSSSASSSSYSYSPFSYSPLYSSSPSEDESNIESPLKRMKKSLDGRAKKVGRSKGRRTKSKKRSRGRTKGKAKSSTSRRPKTKCKAGYKMNRISRRCRKSCVLGQRRSRITGRCRKKSK
jgi:hypothetical protein